MASPWTLRAAGPARGAIDAGEVRRALAVLADPAAGVHVQGIPSGRSATVGGADADGLIRAAHDLGGGQQVYLTVNPVPAGLNRAPRKGDILARRWLWLDVDAAKPDGVNASEVEHEAAHALATVVWEYLLGEWGIGPVLIDSGNGWHMGYRIDLPADELTRVLLKGCLRRLGERFGDDGRGIFDRGVYPATIKTKLPGTWVRKFDEQDGRPWRMARLAHVPDPVRVVPVEALKSLAGVYGEAPPPKPAPPPRDPARLRATAGRDAAYLKTVLERQVRRVLAAGPGERERTLTSAAYNLGRWVPAGLDRAEAEARLVEAGLACGLGQDPAVGERGVRERVARRLTAGAEEAPRQVPEPSANGHHAAEADAPAVPAVAVGDKPHWTATLSGEVIAEGSPESFAALSGAVGQASGRRHFEILRLGELLAAEFAAPNWCIPGLLAEGLNLLAGAPKQGKSMLALNLALTVAGGGKALGNIQTVPGDVLYLSLEDRQRRVQARAIKMCRKLGTDAADRLAVVTDWPRMDQGGLQLLAEWAKRVERPTLVIVDVLQKFRPGIRERGSLYEQDSQHMYAIKDFADGHGLTGLILTHTRKSQGKDKDGDEFEAIMGTQGLGGGCDGMLLLRRARNSNEAVISMAGRDDANVQLALEFDPETLTWRSLGTAEERLTGKLQTAVLDYLRTLNGVPTFVTDICAKLDAPDGSVRKVLHRLFDRGLVRRHGQAWAYPGTAGEGPDEMADPAAF